MVPSGHRAAETVGLAGERMAGEVPLVERSSGGDEQVVQRVAAVHVQSGCGIAAAREQRVRAAIIPGGRAERVRQCAPLAVLVAPRVVPVRQGPAVAHVLGHPGQLSPNNAAHDLFKPVQVDTMPGQEIPAAVLALVAERVHGNAGLHRVHRGLVSPPRRIVAVGRRPLLHHPHRVGVGADHRVPGTALVFEVPDVPTDERRHERLHLPEPTVTCSVAGRRRSSVTMARSRIIAQPRRRTPPPGPALRRPSRRAGPTRSRCPRHPVGPSP